MKTEILKPFRQGYLLSEQELRRLAQTFTDQMVKADPNWNGKIQYIANLSGGSRIETTDLDDVLAIENSGTKTIIGLSLEAKLPGSYLGVAFAHPHLIDRAPPIKLTVVSDSRDWAFLTAAELEERVRRIKVTDLTAVVDPKAAMLLLFVVASLASFLQVSNVFGPSAVTRLEEMVNQGKITDPIRAIIELEKMKLKPSSSFGLVMIPTCIIFALAVFSEKITKAIYSILPAYTFYWGDEIGSYDRKGKRKSIIGSVIILGIIVGLVTTFIAKKIGLG